MPRRKPPGKPRPAYRPAIEIDWKKVEDLMTAGCSAKEIAGYFGVSDDTMYDRFQVQYGASFTEVAASKKSGGHAMIRAKQFQVAMRGSNMMLKLLGEELLKQGRGDGTGDPEIKAAFDKIIDYHYRRQLAESAESSENNSETTNINE